MNCLVKITNVTDGIKQIGSSVVLTRTAFESLNIDEQAYHLITVEYIDELNIVHQLFNPDKTFKDDFIKYLMEIPNDEVFDRIIELDNLSDKDGNTLAHVMVSKRSYKFTIEQLLKIGNPFNNRGETVAHDMADIGHKFMVDELLQLGNPFDNFGFTVAHNMNGTGHRFSHKDVIRLGNPLDRYGRELWKDVE